MGAQPLEEEWVGHVQVHCRKHKLQRDKWSKNLINKDYSWMWGIVCRAVLWAGCKTWWGTKFMERIYVWESFLFLFLAGILLRDLCVLGGCPTQSVAVMRSNIDNRHETGRKKTRLLTETHTKWYTKRYKAQWNLTELLKRNPGDVAFRVIF